MENKVVINKESSPNVVIGDLQRSVVLEATSHNDTATTTTHVEDSRQKHSGMTTFFNDKAFTLIELLVVVLIIGILAAVAVPQYQKAVMRSRVRAMLPLISRIAYANQVYYLANGNWSPNIYQLDISMPTSCKNLTGEAGWGGGIGQVWQCGTDFVIDNSGGRWPSLNFCPGKNITYSSCSNSLTVRIITEKGSSYQCIGPTEICKFIL